ncbi:MAG: hypothetical protein N2652_01995 [Kiritimatiellae bacterium]|nr:hypothetical protein [Kiritimatiellia bacterium]
MSPPDFQQRRDLEERAAELERRLREVRRAIAAAERGRPVTLPPDLQTVRPRSAPRASDPPPPSPSPQHSTVTEAAPPPGASVGRPGRAIAPPPDRERFAHYFGSSFLRGPPPSVERRLQRNRAIVMLIVVAILAYIVYSLAR